MSYSYRNVNGCYVSKRATKKNSHEQVKDWIIAGLAIVVVLLLGVIVNLKRANNLREYAIANNCTWTWQGTATGTDADYICK